MREEFSAAMEFQQLRGQSTGRQHVQAVFGRGP